MQEEITNFYKNINKITYKDYVIDHDFNLNLLFLLNEICILAQENNLDFKLTGAWGFVFQTNNIYRTISDIDLKILKKDFRSWIQALDKDYGVLCEDNPVDFFKKILKKDKDSRIFRFKHKENENKTIDMIVCDKILELECTKISFCEFEITYSLPYKFLKPQQGFEYGRDIDSDDVEFYSKYIN